jgi:hypothetical protein
MQPLSLRHFMSASMKPTRPAKARNRDRYSKGASDKLTRVPGGIEADVDRQGIRDSH